MDCRWEKNHWMVGWSGSSWVASQMSLRTCLVLKDVGVASRLHHPFVVSSGADGPVYLSSCWWPFSLIIGCLATRIKPKQSRWIPKCAKNIVCYRLDRGPRAVTPIRAAFRWRFGFPWIASRLIGWGLCRPRDPSRAGIRSDCRMWPVVVVSGGFRMLLELVRGLCRGRGEGVATGFD